MKKIYAPLITLFATWSLIPAPMTLNDINQMIVSYHNNIFGTDHLFENQISEDNFAAWLEVGSMVDTYVMENCKDIFGIQDTTLIEALQTIEKTNKTLVKILKNTYPVKNHTPTLIKMAVIFKALEKQMKSVRETLNESTFILKRKKNAKSLLLNFALFIEITAQKANKDTRMGHRTDIVLPQTPIKNTPPVDNLTKQNKEATNVSPIYEETPKFSPPTRIPAPPRNIPAVPQQLQPTYEETPEFTPPTRIPVPPRTIPAVPQ